MRHHPRIFNPSKRIDFEFGRALESTSITNSIIAIDFQREKQVNNPLDNFPLLVSIVDTDLRDFARADGFDIFFTKENGTTVIPYERESYDNTTGTLTAWVLTNLTDLIDNKLFMFYGDLNNATDQQDPLPVWSTRFQDVFHFNQISPLPWVNSSIRKDFTFLPGGSIDPSPVVGQIDTASNISVTNTNQVNFNMASTGIISPTDFFTSTWLKFDSFSTEAGTFLDCWRSQAVTPELADITIGSGVVGASIDEEKVELIIIDDNNSISIEILIGDMADMAYHHVAIRYNSAPAPVLGTFDVFFDGSFVSTLSHTFTDVLNFDVSACGDGGGGTTSPQTGRIDELQVAFNSNFSNGFVTTSFDNQKDSGQGAGNFVKVGVQQSTGESTAFKKELTVLASDVTV